MKSDTHHQEPDTCRCRRWLTGLWFRAVLWGCLCFLMQTANAQFTLGTGRVVSVTPLDGGCVSQDLPPSGTEFWNIEQLLHYRVRLENVTECNGDTIHVHLFNPFRDENDPEDAYAPQCVTAQRVGDGVYEFVAHFPLVERAGVRLSPCKTYFIRYCTNADCTLGGVLARRSDGGNAPSLLRLSHFDDLCTFLREDKHCGPVDIVFCDPIDLGCNPDPASFDTCEEVFHELLRRNLCRCPNLILLSCEIGAVENDPDRPPCGKRRLDTFIVKELCNLEVIQFDVYVRWQEDTEPPVIVPPPDRDLGCNPQRIPDCDDILRETQISDNCDHEPITVECSYREERNGCIVTRIFTITAMDKCGNSSEATVRVWWNEDTEPPVVNNVPETDKLPCNTRPTCDLLIARHRIHAKDNCEHEPPTLNCQAGPVEELGNCRFRQVFTFWAVDKCGNRSADYRVAVFWKEDTEPPVLHNVPSGGDLGCNPDHIPTCEDILRDVTATDNCDPQVQVHCSSKDITIECLHFRIFVLAAADECGNVTTRNVVFWWIEDTTPPVVRCPDNITVQAQFPDCLVPVTFRAKAEDTCDPTPQVACDPPSGSFFPLGTTVVTCTATDRCGNRSTCQFTVTVLGYICGLKFEDQNGNGIPDPGEPGLPGWTIELLQNNTVIATTVTGPDGRFCFLGLLPGNYVVREVLQPGWQNTRPLEVVHRLPRDCGKLVLFGNRRLPSQ